MVDDLAMHTFRPPMEGYIQRMLWCLVHQGVMPAEAAHDPWGPALDPRSSGGRRVPAAASSTSEPEPAEPLA